MKLRILLQHVMSGLTLTDCTPEPDRDKGQQTKGLVSTDLSSMGAETKDRNLAERRLTQVIPGTGPAQIEKKCSRHCNIAGGSWTHSAWLSHLQGTQ